MDIELDGLFEGKAGEGASGVVRHQGGGLDRDCGTGELVSLERTDRIVEVVLGGGSGYGDSAERPREDVMRDLADGYVSD